jgi:septum site-determining protein MinD
MSVILAVVSGKGGVGKTTITANLGVELCKLGRKVLLIDADIGNSSLGIHFGLEQAPFTLADLLSGKKDVKKAIYRTPEGVEVMPSSLSLREFLKSNIDLLPNIIEKIKDNYDVILIDSPPGINKNSLVTLKVADEVLVVTTPDLPSISSAVKMKGAAELLDKKTAGAIVNRQAKPRLLSIRAPSMKIEEIEARLGTAVLGAIPEDKNVAEAINAKKPVVSYKPRASISKVFKQLAQKIAPFIPSGV